MDVVSFTWEAKIGHFLKAGANRNALTYPFPPKTAVLGLLGAVLGLEKGQVQTKLNPLIAISGSPPQRFWHKAKLRKDPPVALPYTVTASMEGSKNPRPEKATLINQEWLWKPSFSIFVSLPDQNKVFNQLVERLQNQKWHFCPVMGLAFFIAHLHYIDTYKATALAEGEYEINSLCPAYSVSLAPNEDEETAVQMIRMPVNLDAERLFQHENIYFERKGKPFRVQTSNAWEVGENKLIFF